MPQFAPPNPARMKRPKPVVLPHGTAHKTPASSQLIRLGIGAVRSVLGGGTGRKKKCPPGCGAKPGGPGRHKRGEVAAPDAPLVPVDLSQAPG